MKNINYLIFDIGGVLVNHFASLKKIAHQLDLSEEKTISLFKKHTDDLDSGRLSWTKFEHIFYDSLQPTLHLHESLLEAFINNFMIIEETHRFITEIKSRFKIGILSNMDRDVYSYVQKRHCIPDIAYCCEVISAEVGFIKPDRKIFEYTLQVIKARPEEVLFIDDKIENIQGARQAGWKGTVFDTQNPSISISQIKKLLII